jgi:hypothetical protein
MAGGLMASEAVGVLAVMAWPVRLARSPGLLRLKHSHELASYRALAAITGSAGCVMPVSATAAAALPA